MNKKHTLKTSDKKYSLVVNGKKRILVIKSGMK